ncbi:MAG TPA: hypothetical protein VKA84_28915 [Gemmatimonadaceae bacterium]|nr:hypothetical protein [Gemmatimonadaceae bacterium]
MQYGDFSNPFLAVVSSIAYGFASALLPFVNTELFIIFLGTVARRRPAALAALVVLVTASSMAGKAVLYVAGRQFERLPPGRFRDRIAAARARLGAHTQMGGVALFASALFGLPPFYLTTIASGVLRFGMLRFLLIGFAGRLLRFAIVAAAPQMLEAWWL